MWLAVLSLVVPVKCIAVVSPAHPVVWHQILFGPVGLAGARMSLARAAKYLATFSPAAVTSVLAAMGVGEYPGVDPLPLLLLLPRLHTTHP